MKKILRARSEKTKEIRRAAIIKAAVQIVDKKGFQSLTMESVAKKSGLGKATLYGYVQTREELLLTILQEDFTAWFSAFRSYLQQAESPFSDALVQIWIAGIQGRPRLATGLTYLHTQLEPNVSFEFALQWKRFLHSQIKEIHCELISRFQPTIPLTLLGDFFVTVTGITLGLWAQSQSNPTIHAVYEKNRDLMLLKTDFEAQMSLSLKAVLCSPAYLPLRELKVQK